jgi:alpha-tubulin suppressor-like RCC1 family protein
MKRMRFVTSRSEAFALPTILIASVIMLTVLTAAVTAVSSLSRSIETQYYNRLSREAAESGIARAKDCLKQSPTGTPQWSEMAPLRPNTNCNGSIITGKSEYITTAGNVRTSFRVGVPAGGFTDATRLSATGNLNIVRSSDNATVWRAYSQTVAQDSRYQNQPKIAGGAGWQNNGHLASILTTDQQLYAFGANDMGQVNDVSSPTAAAFPIKVTLPSGVTSVSSVKTSGQGASIMCILSNTAQVYCRGAAGAAENGLMPSAIGWQQFTLPAGVTAMDFSIDGYGSDKLCVLGSDGQAYCAGENYYGSMGNGNTAYAIYKINGATPQRFAVPAGVTLNKIYSGPVTTCGIATTGDMYCAGLNNNGQLTGPSTAGTGNGVYSTPIKYTLPGAAGARKVKSVLVSYHGGGASTVHVLATDGTMWSSGAYANGDLGHSTTAGSTGTSQAPIPFTTSQKSYAAGSEIWNANASKCVDNNAGSSTNGNTIHLWDCSASANHPNQTWYYGSNQQLTNYGTGKCIDVPGNSSTDGTAVQLYDCNNTAAQKFTLVGGISGNTIKHISSGKCLDARSGGTANGTIVQIYTCNGSAAQSLTRWSGIMGWQDMITGTDHFCGLRSDLWSGMWCSGINTHGQLMNWASAAGSFLGQCVSTPSGGYNYLNVNLPNGDKVDVSKLSDEWRQQFRSTMVIGMSGKVYGAGRDQYGKFGDGAINTANDYQNCVTAEFQLPSGVTAVDLSTRDEYTSYVLGSDGRIYAAGRNNNGQVGDGTTADRLIPVEVKVPRQTTAY